VKGRWICSPSSTYDKIFLLNATFYRAVIAMSKIKTTEQIASASLYYAVYIALVILTIGTVGLSFCNLQNWHTIVGLIIATCKATLVALFFMHLLHNARITWLALFAGLFWLAILMSLTLTDYLSRSWLLY
jgi:cytochrome c oxidase subunit IV